MERHMQTDLWQFANSCYTRPGVEQACLQLQAEGADVCLLLCALWLEQRGVGFDSDRSRQLQQAAAEWQAKVISPMRQLRQAWKVGGQQDAALEKLRNQIKAIELQAERELLGRLGKLSEDWQVQGRAEWLEALAGETCRPTLQRLREAADPERIRPQA
jgi:uncharacterized protein (TIGR02444 family)